MNKYLISNPQFSGAAELVYIDGHLKTIEAINTDMSPDTFQRFKHAVPVLEENLKVRFGADTTIVAADFEVTFAMFWQTYCQVPGNRVTVKINKKRAEKAWAKLSLSKQVKAWAGVAPYDKYLKKESWRNKADPETYLNNEMWEDGF